MCPSSLVSTGRAPARVGLRATLVVSALLAALASGSAAAGVIGIPAPPSVLPGALQNNTNAYIFQEQTITLSAPLAVDIANPGTYNKNNPVVSGVIPAGTRVTSYYLHHESVNGAFGTALGTLFSPTKILGIITSDAGLNQTDPLLGSVVTNPNYPTGLEFRGMELTYPVTPDAVTWAGNLVVVSFVSNTQAVLDGMRIVAIAVPEPSTLALALLGAGAALAAWRRRRRVAAR